MLARVSGRWVEAQPLGFLGNVSRWLTLLRVFHGLLRISSFPMISKDLFKLSEDSFGIPMGFPRNPWESLGHFSHGKLVHSKCF